MLTSNEPKASIGAVKIGNIMSETIQKVIKIGSSLGVTIPAKEAKRQGIKPGDEVKFTVEPVKGEDHKQIMDEYQQFVQEYGQTLKNLADR